MTLDTGAHIEYAAGCQVARSFFHETERMSTDVFDKVDWPHVYRTLHEKVSRLFQVWTCEQVMNIAATNKNQVGGIVMGRVISALAAGSMSKQQSTFSSAQRLTRWRHSSSSRLHLNDGLMRQILTRI